MTDNFDWSEFERKNEGASNLIAQASASLAQGKRRHNLHKMTPVWAWLYLTQGMERYQVTGNEWQSVSEQEILQIVEKCSFTELDDMSEMPDVKSGRMFGIGLNCWWGSEIKAAKFGNTETDGILFFVVKVKSITDS